MKRNSLITPVTAAAGGLLAYLLRVLENTVGFTNGLPRRGTSLHILVPVCFCILAGILWLQTRQSFISRKLEKNYTTQSLRDSILFLGLLFMAISGIVELSGAVDTLRMPPTATIMGSSGASKIIELDGNIQASRVIFSSGAASLMTVIGLLPSALAGRKNKLLHDVAAIPLLFVPLCTLFQLLTVYRSYSVDPVLLSYYLEILTLTFLTLAFYRLTSFSFHAGNITYFVLCSGLAEALAIAMLADCHTLSENLFYGGAALTLFGFSGQRLASPRSGLKPKPQETTSLNVESQF